jgi:hypothetical protein
MAPAEVFVLRIVLADPQEDQAVHGVVEIVRNDRRYAFNSLEGLVQLLRRELEGARSGPSFRPRG